MSQNANASYIAPLRFKWLTGAYDVIVRVTTLDAVWRPKLIAQIGAQAGHRVLDLGCGTGDIALQLKKANPNVEVVGLDADATALRIAREKAHRTGAEISFEQSLFDDASFEPGSFNRVASSLVFHHLEPDAKARTLARVKEWLKPDGELHIADWGRARFPWQRLGFFLVQLLDGFSNTQDHVRVGLKPLLREAGFVDVAETHRQTTPLGVISLYRARRNLLNAASLPR